MTKIRDHGSLTWTAISDLVGVRAVDGPPARRLAALDMAAAPPAGAAASASSSAYICSAMASF
jgi:hypothetical protein